MLEHQRFVAGDARRRSDRRRDQSVEERGRSRRRGRVADQRAQTHVRAIADVDRTAIPDRRAGRRHDRVDSILPALKSGRAYLAGFRRSAK